LFPRRPEHFWPPSGPTGQAKGMNQSGELRPSIWLGPRIVGRWELDKVGRQRRVVHRLDHDLDPRQRDELDARISDLQRFVNERLVPISGGR
jgi:hypothetical protein